MHEITFQTITYSDPEVVLEWAWVCRQWPLSLQKWIEIGPELKERAKRFVEPEKVIRYWKIQGGGFDEVRGGFQWTERGGLMKFKGVFDEVEFQ